MIVLATDNPNKVVELADLLAALSVPIDVRPRPNWVAEVEETGTTFVANADLKATAVARAVGQWALADDSGLEVDVLNGAPGVRSARFAADLAAAAGGVAAASGNSTDEDNRQALIARLAALEATPRPSARFRCALSLADPQGEVALRAEGVVEGRLTTRPLGDAGFGYDPMFIPDDGDGSTFAQMDPSAKAAISHRGRALGGLISLLESSGWFVNG